MITLTDCISSVEIHMAWGSNQPESKINNVQQTINGTQFDYQWAFVNGYSVIAENLDIDTVKQINEWWRDNTELFINQTETFEAFILGDPYWGVLGQSYNPLRSVIFEQGGSVFISNGDQPFQSVKRPYNNEADGLINLEFI